MLRMLKVKITNEKKIHMIWEVQNKSSGWDDFSFTCSDEAMPSFYNAVDKLAWHVIDMCELPELYLRRITVKGVSFSYQEKSEIMGCTISASMELEKSHQSLNLNTPFKPCEPYNDGEVDSKAVLSSKCVADILNLVDECKLYIRGDRAQTDLFNSTQNVEIDSTPIEQEV